MEKARDIKGGYVVCPKSLRARIEVYPSEAASAKRMNSFSLMALGPLKA